MRFAALKTDWLLMSVLVLVATSLTVVAQEAPKKKKAADEPSGRLPAYYKDVVDETQRKKIYEIQSKYKTKIDVLAEEVKSLQSQRDKEIEALLSPEQKEKLAKVKAEADKKKAATAASIKATEEAKEAKAVEAPKTEAPKTEPPKSTATVPAPTVVPVAPAPVKPVVK